MSEFKVGDKVTPTHVRSNSVLDSKRVYTVLAVRPPYIDVDYAGRGWFAHRFKLVDEEKINVADAFADLAFNIHRGSCTTVINQCKERINKALDQL